MKYFIILFGFCTVLSCSNDYQHESDVCDCYRESLKTEKEDFDSVIIRLEERFIATGELASNSGEDYYESLYKMSQTGLPSIDSFDVDIFADLIRMEDVKFDTACVSIRFDTTRESKLTTLNAAIDSIAQNESATFTTLLKTHMRYVTAEGYTEPLYKSDYYYFYGIAMDNFFNSNQ